MLKAHLKDINGVKVVSFVRGHISLEQGCDKAWPRCNLSAQCNLINQVEGVNNLNIGLNNDTSNVPGTYRVHNCAEIELDCITACETSSFKSQ